MITHTWNVDRVECLPELNGISNVITRVFWILTSTNGDVTVENSHATDLSVSPSGTFADYTTLTEQDILNWVFDELGFNGNRIYETEAEHQIELKLKPALVSPPLPWDTFKGE